MTDLEEKLAFPLDDYVDENAEADLDEVVGDVNLQYRMRRYQMIGEVLRHELPQAIDTSFNSSVMARIRDQAGTGDTQPTVAIRTPKNISVLDWALLKPFAGLAVAASVAIVTVALWQPLNQGPGQVEENLVSADELKIQELANKAIKNGAVPVSARVQPLGMRWKVDQESPGLQQKLNGYLVNHTEYSNSMQGLIPQARVAGFDSQQ